MAPKVWNEWLKALKGECDAYYIAETEYAKQVEQTIKLDPLSVFEIPKPRPPEEMRLMWEIEQWQALPWSGGLLDQPSQIMDAVNVCRNAKIDAAQIASFNEALHANAPKPSKPEL